MKKKASKKKVVEEAFEPIEPAIGVDELVKIKQACADIGMDSGVFDRMVNHHPDNIKALALLK